MYKCTALVLASAVAAAPLPADCANNDVGIPALTDQTGNYAGNPNFPGGLYPGGTNTRPPGHTAVGLEQAALVLPRDSNGNVVTTPNGRIGFIELGMSNAKQVAQPFNQQCLADAQLSRKITYVDVCQYGKTLDVVADPGDVYWTTNVPAAVRQRNLTNEQVQVAWIMNATRSPDDWPPFPDHLTIEAGFWIDVLRNAKAIFPNLAIAYLDAIQFQGYSSQKEPLDEPFAFEQGFAVRQVITQQINGDPQLDLSRAPWLSWGAYFWCNGIVARSDGMKWLCPTDCAGDGIHLSTAGGQKLATQLRTKLKADVTAMPWLLR